jgi:hypothetical protein
VEIVFAKCDNLWVITAHRRRSDRFDLRRFRFPRKCSYDNVTDGVQQFERSYTNAIGNINDRQSKSCGFREVAVNR